MKGKILSCFYDEQIGIGYLEKATKYGTFEYTTFCDDEDFKKQNKWDAGHFAEYQCDLQALKEKNKWMGQRIIGMKQMLKLVNEDSQEYKKLNDFVYSVEKQLKKDKVLYKALKDKYVEYTVETLKAREELVAKVKNKEN